MLPTKNDTLIESMKAYFVQQAVPTTSWGNAVSIHLLLPALRAFWPMSSMDETGWAYDISGQGHAVEYTGDSMYNVYGMAPYIDFSTDYLKRSVAAGDSLDITGLETKIAVGLRGFTIGGWFWFDINTLQEGMIGRYSGTPSYIITHEGAVANDPVRFTVYNGATTKSIDSAVISTGQWYHCVGRFIPSTSVDLYVNGVKTSNTTAIPASVNSSASPFNIGGFNNGGGMDGRASLCFVAASALPERIILALYQHSRALFGV